MKKQLKQSLKPVTTIVEKRSLFVPILIIVVLIAAAIAIYLFTKTSPQGNILVTVNGAPLYEETITAEYNRLPSEYRAQYTKEQILNQTIDKTLLLQEGKKQGFIVSADDISAQINEILAQYGIQENDLKRLLEAQNITLEQYRGYVREELLVNKVLQESVINKITITDNDLVSYYDNNPAEFTAPPGGVIVSLILVENESDAKKIISLLNNGSVFSSLVKEYSIDNTTADNGGYLGIVTNETPYVEPFVKAALKLKLHQYTRTPIKTDYGYHIILRNNDVEPFKQVRSRIDKQLEIQKQTTLFKEFMAGLRSKATIKYYADSGIVTTTIDETVKPGALDAFAICVAGKSTIYGTSWSDFFKQQQVLFGESFSKLNSVDCDAKPSACAEANIQKYPTWIIGGQQYGKMSLQEIADKSGCTLST